MEIYKNRMFEKCFPWGICLIPVFFAFFCCLIKSGYFVDEYYSYGFANSSKGFSLVEVFDGNLVGKVITPIDLKNYIMVEPEEAFSYDFITKNCSDDMTPPLYFYILHTICSLFPGAFSKWFGLGINLISYYFIMLFLYKSANTIFCSRWVSTLVVFFYGFSLGGLNCVTYIRMYAFVTLLTVLLTYFAIKSISEERVHCSILTGIVIYLGFMTQYNFGIYAFFVCAATCIALLYQKKIKQLLVWSTSSIFGVSMFIVMWPSFLAQTTNVLVDENEFKPYFGFWRTMYLWIKILSTQVKIEVLILFILVCLIIILKKFFKIKLDYNIDDGNYKRIIIEYFVVAVSLILGTAGITHFSIFYVERYCYIVMPFFALVMGLPLAIFHKQVSLFLKMKKGFSVNYIGAILALVAIIGSVRLDEMAYLNMGNCETLLLTEKFASCPCFFVNTNYAKSITGAIDHLVFFKEIYVTDDLSAENYHLYIDNNTINDAIIVFVDNDPTFSSGLDGDKVINDFMSTGLFDNAVGIITLESSNVYLLYNDGYLSGF